MIDQQNLAGPGVDQPQMGIPVQQPPASNLPPPNQAPLDDFEARIAALKNFQWVLHK